MNPDKVDAYSKSRAIVDPNYKYTVKANPAGTPTTPTIAPTAPTPSYRQPAPAPQPTITPEVETPSFTNEQQQQDDTGNDTGTGSGLDAIGPVPGRSAIKSPRFSSRYMLGTKAKV